MIFILHINGFLSIVLIVTYNQVKKYFLNE